MENNKKGAEAQGVETPKKKEQKYSVSYGLKALANHITNMEKEGVFTREEIEKLKKFTRQELKDGLEENSDFKKLKKYENMENIRDS